MREIITITHVSLDGVMQAPGGPEEDPSNGFTHGGWAMTYNDDAAHKVIDAIIANEFDILLGRRTYQIFASYWPHHDDNPIGKAFNRATKHVATRTLDLLEWQNSRRIEGDIVAGVRRLKESDGPPLHVWGSGNLLQTLMAAELIDEYRLWVFPLILGTGKRLFENGLPPRRFHLVESTATPDGVLLNTYRPAGPLKNAR